MIEKKSIGTEIRRHRLEHELSARELARRAGVATSTVTHAERHEHVPHLENLRKIASALNIAVRDLL